MHHVVTVAKKHCAFIFQTPNYMQCRMKQETIYLKMITPKSINRLGVILQIAFFFVHNFIRSINFC